MDTRITVVVPFYNEEKWIPATLKSLKENLGDIDALIFSDNGSTDGSLVLVREAFGDCEKVTILESGLPDGGQRNLWDHMRRICRKVQTPYMMFHRAKDFLSPGYFATMKRAFAAQPDAVGFYPVIEMFFEKYVSPEACVDVLRAKEFSHPMPVADRLRAVYASKIAYHLLWCPVKTELMQLWLDHVDDVEVAVDYILPCRCALAGQLSFVPEATWYRFLRRETLEEVHQRYRRDGKLTVQEVNPYWYVLYEFWHLCKLHVSEAFTDRARPHFDRYMRMILDADWNDADWMMRHTYETALLHLRELVAGRRVVLFGTGVDGKTVFSALHEKIDFGGAWDNHPKDSSFMGLDVRRPERHCGAFILIASTKYQLEMLDQLEELGYAYERDWIAISELHVLIEQS